MQSERVTSERLFKRPRLRSIENGGGERHASWFELLFFDLVFVVATHQTTRQPTTVEADVVKI